MLYTAISVLHVCICLLLVLLVLLQQGKGADAGATFGGGGANTLFGAGGADTFLTKATTILAFLFMTTSFSLAVSSIPATEGGAPASKLFQNAPATAPVPAADPVTLTPEMPAPEAGAAAKSESSVVSTASSVNASSAAAISSVDGAK
jgi:preprotein translocase subunit SecG